MPALRVPRGPGSQFWLKNVPKVKVRPPKLSIPQVAMEQKYKQPTASPTIRHIVHAPGYEPRKGTLSNLVTQSGFGMAQRAAGILGQVASGVGPLLAEIEASKPPLTGGYGAGTAPAAAPEPTPLSKIKWKEGQFDLQHARAPEWWKPFTPANKADMKRPDVAFLAMLNASIPYLSPEDQINAAAQLYAIDANHFASYKPEEIKPYEKRVISQATALLSDEYKRDPSQFTVMTPDMRRYYQSAERAEGFTDMLNQLREQTGVARKLVGGTGMPYTWLQQVAGTLTRQGGEAGVGQTRAQYMQMLGALDPLLALGKAPEIGGALGIGQMFAKPFFSPRPLQPRHERYGETYFGQANPLLYR